MLNLGEESLYNPFLLISDAYFLHELSPVDQFLYVEITVVQKQVNLL